MVKLLFFSAMLAFLLTLQAPRAQALDVTPAVYVQALVGAAQFSRDDLSFQRSVGGDTSTALENDLSNMPYLGLAVQVPFGGGNISWGLDSSFLYGWRSRNTHVVASNNQLAISVDTELWLADLAAGLYIAHSSRHWRAYVAAGPAVVFGEYDEKNNLSADSPEQTLAGNSDSEFGVGAYIRAGIEYRLRDQGFVGFGVRELKTNIEFDSAPGASSGLSGVQGFLSFSRFY
ncbi:outer membrane beta-barrel protein [Geopsychrobacter electrodiphilus]|uniref:outer membrane beta-barrel protein n=1 Tax=Geopsychrobacter electrodiphilus TaxID=225196 RepID=UPI0003699B7D|nr:outer membrane beta-barrel protein [Geopsychrobacter electrodiphilus]